MYLSLLSSQMHSYVDSSQFKICEEIVHPLYCETSHLSSINYGMDIVKTLIFYYSEESDLRFQ